MSTRRSRGELEEKEGWERKDEKKEDAFSLTLKMLAFALWFRTAKKWDVSTRPLAHPFAHSLAPFTHSLCAHAPLHSFVRGHTRSLPSFWESK